MTVLGAGAWAYVRSRGRRQSSDDTTPRSGSDDGTEASSPRSSTAVKDRPAAPTWADTLSAPASKPAPHGRSLGGSNTGADRRRGDRHRAVRHRGADRVGSPDSRSG